MRFKNYLQEGIIVPDKINVKTRNIDKLNKQFQSLGAILDLDIEFQNTPIDPKTGKHYDSSAEYVPDLDTIYIYLHPEVPYNTIEYLIQHEIIHYFQDKRSNWRMAHEEMKRKTKIDSVVNTLMKLGGSPEECAIHPNFSPLCKELSNLQREKQFLNHQEEMAYAYAMVKLRDSDDFKKVFKDYQKWWIKETGKKISKRMMNYIYQYWIVKDQL